MTDSASSSSSGSWGPFTPIMPATVRLVVSVIVLVVVEAIVLGFPGVTSNISGTQISIATLAVFFVGFVVSLIVLKFGTQLSNAVSNAYKAYRTWTPLLAYCFQVIAIVILYAVTNPIASPYMTSAPWAYPLIFLLIALIPTMKVVVNLVHALEGTPSSKHGQNYGQN